MSKKVAHIIPPRCDKRWMIREENRSRAEPWPFIVPPALAPEIGALLKVKIPEVDLKVIDANLNDWSVNEVKEQVAAFNPDIIIVQMSGFHIPLDRACAELEYPTIAVITPVAIPREEAIELYNLKTKYFVKNYLESVCVDAVKEFLETGDIVHTKGILVNDVENKILLDTGSASLPDYDNLPIPDFEAYSMGRYIDEREKIEGRRTGTLDSLKGCFFKCSFCSHAAIHEKGKYKSVEYFIKTLKTLKEKYRITHFELFDVEFSADLDRAKEVCKAMIKENLKLSWAAQNRFDLVDQELINLMKEAGCWRIAYGLETVVREFQRSIRKVVDLNRVENVVRWTKEAGIHCKVYLTPGFMGETYETLKESIDFVEKIEPDEFTCGSLIPLPGTGFYKECQEKGILLEKDWSKYKRWQMDRVMLFKHNTFKTFDEYEAMEKWYAAQMRYRLALKKIKRLKNPIQNLKVILNNRKIIQKVEKGPFIEQNKKAYLELQKEVS